MRHVHTDALVKPPNSVLTWLPAGLKAPEHSNAGGTTLHQHTATAQLPYALQPWMLTLAFSPH